MEKKSIGRFIATLRKANGMTQKELAEQLNVSDKTISRWERDESAPELSLIPVIAEIFHVTSDEILRGERVSYQEQTAESYSEKGKKQITMLLKKSRTRFQMYSLIAVGIAGVGLFVAMICNFGFFRAHIGFFAGCIFYLAAVIFLVIMLLHTRAAIQIEEAEETELIACKNEIMKWFVGAIVVVITLFAFTLPLIIQVSDAYFGLSFDALLQYCLPMAVLAAAAGVVFWWILSIKKFSLSEKEAAVYQLKLKYFKRTAITLAMTILAHLIFNSVFAPKDFVEGTKFETYEEFVEYMEIRADYDPLWNNENASVNVEILEEIYYDENGNEISQDDWYDEAWREYLYDKEGNVLCSYLPLNQNIAEIDYSDIEDGYLPITVYSYGQLRQGQVIMDDLITPIWMIVYVIELAVGIFSYKRRWEK